MNAERKAAEMKMKKSKLKQSICIKEILNLNSTISGVNTRTQ